MTEDEKAELEAAADETEEEETPTTHELAEEAAGRIGTVAEPAGKHLLKRLPKPATEESNEASAS